MSSAVIVGGGQSGVETAAWLRAGGFDGEITVLTDEPTLPYHRPPLSKDYLAGKSEVDGNTLRGESFYERKDISLRRGVTVTGIDRQARRVHLDTGETAGYEHLVLATGARPRRLPTPGADLPGVLPLRSLADSTRLRELLHSARSAVVIGAGFIGLECAAVAASLGVPTTVVEATGSAMSRVVSKDTADYVVWQHQKRGNTILFERSVHALHGDPSGVRAVELDDGRELPADVAIVGIGVVPNTELAESAGLAVSDGIVVDEYLRTSDPSIHAVGDCANYPSRYAPGRVRLESVQNAVDHARCVAADITGTPAPYTAVPWFWTDQLGMKVQIAGLATGTEETVMRPGTEPGSFSVFRFTGDRLAAVESVNRPRDHMSARRLLAGGIGLTKQQAADPDVDLKALAGPTS